MHDTMIDIIQQESEDSPIIIMDSDDSNDSACGFMNYVKKWLSTFSL